MKLTTLCYIENQGKYLMLHRIYKKNDPNKDKWIGVGGKFKNEESPDECLLREVYEETGLTLNSYKFRGIVTFISDVYESEYMHLFTTSEYSGEIIACNEGVLEWIEIENIFNLNLWEGDKIFLKLLRTEKDFFSLKLSYKGEKLVDVLLNGKRMQERI